MILERKVVALALLAVVPVCFGQVARPGSTGTVTGVAPAITVTTPTIGVTTPSGVGFANTPGIGVANPGIAGTTPGITA